MKLMALAGVVAAALAGGCSSRNEGGSASPGAAQADATTPRQVTEDDIELLHDVVIGRGGGRDLHAEIARPKVPPKKPMPAVLVIHGGGWAGGSYKDSKMYTWLASHGYFAATVEYRLSGEAKWPAQIEDCKLAVRWLRANAAKYNVNPDRIGCVGGSAGGHLCFCLATLGDKAELEGTGGYPGVSSKVQAVVSYSGPADLTRKFPTDHVQRLIGAPLAEKPEAYRQASPALNVRPGLPPFMVAHGEADTTVPFEQAEAMVAALKAAGVTVTYIPVKGGGHDLNAPPSDKDAMWNAALEFYNRHLGTP